MTLVEKGTHPKWTGGFSATVRCGRCGHAEAAHVPDQGVGCMDWNIRGERYTPCRCTGFKPEER